MSYPKYECHKVVEAFKIKEVRVNPSWAGQHLLIPEDINLDQKAVDSEYLTKHRPEAGGYWVCYDGGYESFSPASAFESGYKLTEAWKGYRTDGTG